MMVLGMACRPPEPDSPLRSEVKKRIEHDRTGACLAVALIAEDVQHTVVCADQARNIDEHTVFEIGSITKTMTGTMLASVLADTTISLDAGIATYLPAETKVPNFEGAPILIRHLVTHTSGLPALPARLEVPDIADPYAKATEQMLFDSLQDVQLAQAPGTKWSYSNFGFMLLSTIVARTSEQDFESLMRQRLFEPLGMKHAYLSARPSGAQVAEGHLGTGEPTSPWHVTNNLAGAGGVHASLDDMVRYARAQLGHGDAATVALVTKTHDAVFQGETGQPEMGLRNLST